MWLFLIIIIFSACAGSCIKLSLYELWRNSVLIILAMTAAIALLSPIGMSINTIDIDNFIDNYNTLTNLCTAVIIESLIVLLLSAHLLSSHVSKKNTWKKAFFLIPSPVMLAGLFMGLTLCYNKVNGYSYGFITIAFLITSFLVIMAGQWLIRICFSHWQGRLDLILVMSFIQLVIAMFLPHVVAGRSVPVIADQSYGKEFLISILCLAVLALGTAKLRNFIGKRYGDLQI